MKTICLLGLALTVAAGAAPAEPYRTDINPALLYYRAFLVPVDPISDADQAYLESKKGRETRLPERFGKLLSGSDYPFHLVRQAAHAQVPCDWGIDLSPGPLVALPHLARAKAVAQLAQVRARWALEQGRPESACDELQAAFVLGRNTASDRLLIGAFVQHAIEMFNYRTVATHFGEFPVETLRALVAGFDAAPARQTLAACVPSEKALAEWVVYTIEQAQRAHPSDDGKAIEAMAAAGMDEVLEFGGQEGMWSRLVGAAGGTSEGMLRLAREIAPLFPQLEQLLALPQADYEPAAARFADALKRSPNPFLNNWAGVWGQFGIRAREFRAQAHLEMLRAAVQYRLGGEGGFRSVRDPFGSGPFGFRRFVHEGEDRGFEVRSAYAGVEAPFAMIYVEKSGPAFHVSGPKLGQPLEK